MSTDEFEIDTPECDHDWLDGQCTRCQQECECMDLNAATWDEDGHCRRCGLACDHDDMDGCWCLICGADRTEDLMAQAYDRAKDAWKYGD